MSKVIRLETGEDRESSTETFRFLRRPTGHQTWRKRRNPQISTTSDRSSDLEEEKKPSGFFDLRRGMLPLEPPKTVTGASGSCRSKDRN